MAPSRISQRNSGRFARIDSPKTIRRKQTTFILAFDQFALIASKLPFANFSALKRDSQERGSLGTLNRFARIWPSKPCSLDYLLYKLPLSTCKENGIPQRSQDLQDANKMDGPNWNTLSQRANDCPEPAGTYLVGDAQTSTTTNFGRMPSGAQKMGPGQGSPLTHPDVKTDGESGWQHCFSRPRP